MMCAGQLPGPGHWPEFNASLLVPGNGHAGVEIKLLLETVPEGFLVLRPELKTMLSPAHNP